MPAGYTTQAGIVREAIVFDRTWPGLPATVTRLLSLLSEDVQTSLDQQSLVTRQSRSVPEFAKLIRQSSPGSIETYLQYQGSELFFLGAMGQEAVRINGTAMPEEIVAGEVYRRLIEVDSDISQAGWKAGDGFIAGTDDIIAKQQKVRRMTFAALKRNQVWETNSVMINSLIVQGNPQGVVLQADVVGYDTTYSGSTANASIGNLVRNNDRVLFQDVNFFAKPALAGSISNSDLIDVSGFQIRIDNNLEIVNTRETGTFIEEPQRQACVISGGFAIPRWIATDFLDPNHSNQALNIKIECVGPEIGTSGEFHRVIFYLPNVLLTGGEIPAVGPEQVIQNYSFLALASGEVTGVPVGTTFSPLLVEFYSDDSSHLLLD